MEMNFNFNAREHTPTTGSFTIPNGWYNGVIEKAELKPTKKGDGCYVEAIFKILDQDYDSVTIYQKYNVKNPNPKAVEIAEEQLSALCHAVEVYDLNNDNLHTVCGVPIKVLVTLKKGTEGYSDKNEIGACRDSNAKVPLVVDAKKSIAQQAPARPQAPPTRPQAPPARPQGAPQQQNRPQQQQQAPVAHGQTYTDSKQPWESTPAVQQETSERPVWENNG